VQAFQVAIDATGYISGTNGKVLPEGWCAPVGKIECAESSTCPTAYTICMTDDPITHNDYGCTCGAHDPAIGSFITTSRPDRIFDGVLPLPWRAVDTASLNYVFWCLTLESIGVPDTGVPRYIGTLVLKVSQNACGTFTIGFLTGPESPTYLGDPSSPPLRDFPPSQPLVLTVPDCCRPLWSCLPQHCNIDARSSHAPDAPSVRYNTNTLMMAFCEPTANMTADDFEATIVPERGVVPGISSVASSGNAVTIVLTRRIAPEESTCVRPVESNRRCCIGSLPGDVDGDRISLRDGGFELLDNLSGKVSPELSIEKCDIDRSLLCTPADLLMFVDLRNDPFFFDFEDCGTLPVCPSFIPPP
jgi:hypothetical protein